MNHLKRACLGLAALGTTLFASAAAFAEEAPKLDTGDTAWMLTSTALVLMMTVPGLALFYGGLVRKKNVLATVMQSFAITAVITIVWMVVGYSLAFKGDGAYVGDLSAAFLNGIGVDTLSGTIPETVFVMFQMTFAIITPALIFGAVADRMKFSAVLIYVIGWSILCYSPICHWVWRRLPEQSRRSRLRGRHGRSHQLRCGGSRGLHHARQASRLQNREHGSA